MIVTSASPQIAVLVTGRRLWFAILPNGVTMETGRKRSHDDVFQDDKSCASDVWTCSVCGRNDFRCSQALGSHLNSCREGGDNSVTQEKFSLKPTLLTERISILSSFNQLVTKSIELFEAAENDVERQNRGCGKRRIQVGDVGIRCKYCANSNKMTSGSIHYASNLKLLHANIYVMADRHLLKNCPSIDADQREEMRTTKKSTTRESMSAGRIGLPVYLKDVIAHFSLTDNGATDGVRRQPSRQNP